MTVGWPCGSVAGDLKMQSGYRRPQRSPPGVRDLGVDRRPAEAMRESLGEQERFSDAERDAGKQFLVGSSVTGPSSNALASASGAAGIVQIRRVCAAAW